MQIDPAAVLALISSLTAQNAQLIQENTQLRIDLDNPCCAGPAGYHQPPCPKGQSESGT